MKIINESNLLLVALSVVIALFTWVMSSDLFVYSESIEPFPCLCECGEQSIWLDKEEIEPDPILWMDQGYSIWHTDDRGVDHPVYEFDPTINWGKMIDQNGDTIEINF
jgi:hypothetical protein